MSVGGQGQGSGAFRGYEPGGVPCGLLAFALVDAEEHGIKIKAMDAKIDALSKVAYFNKCNYVSITYDKSNEKPGEFALQSRSNG